MVFPREQEQCARSLINNNVEGRKQCPMTVTTIDPRPRQVETGQNQFVVYTQDENYSYRCPKQVDVIGNLKEGLYIVTIEQSCVLDAFDWMLEGIEYRETDLNGTEKLILPELPHINTTFIEYVEQTFNKTRHQQLHFHKYQKLANMEYQPLKPVYIPHHVTDKIVMAICVIAVLVVVGLCIWCWCCNCYCPSWCAKMCRRKHKLPRDVEADNAKMLSSGKEPVVAYRDGEAKIISKGSKNVK